MNKLRSKRITLTLCETLIYKLQNPKPSCAEIRSSLPRQPRQALPCARTSLPAHEANSTGSPVRRTGPPAHEANSTDPTLPCARKSLLLTRPMNMTAGAPEGRFHARKTILREGNQLVAELDFPVAEFVEALVTSTGSVPYMT
ncbi:MAG: hypothetical protein PUJ46_11985 [Alistipes sp.]|nr:hypothetical protein [Alistipes sp.]